MSGDSFRDQINSVVCVNKELVMMSIFYESHHKLLYDMRKKVERELI